MPSERAVVSRPHSAENLDDVFDALADRHRRVVVRELEWGEPTTVEELAGVVADRVDGTTVDGARIRLVHCHLPKLAEANVVTYDHDEQVCELDDAVTARAVLSSLRTGA